MVAAGDVRRSRCGSRPAACGRTREAQTTSVRRAARAASGPSAARRPAGRPCRQLKASSLSRLLWWSHEAWYRLTNRTPRSTSRRASRQLVANDVIHARAAAAAAPCPARRPVDAVRVERLLRLARQIDQLRRGRLHAEGQFVGGDAAVDLRIADRCVPLRRSARAGPSMRPSLHVARSGRPGCSGSGPARPGCGTARPDTSTARSRSTSSTRRRWCRGRR